MAKTLVLELMRDAWMMHENSIHLYAQLAHDVLAGKEVATGFFSSLKLPDTPSNIALIAMVGPLAKSDICEAKGSRTLSNEIEAAAKDSAVQAIIIMSEGCPGGQVDGTEQLGNAVTNARKQKPVIGVISGLAASASYWVMSQCDEVYCTSNTDLVGCIGTVGRMRNPKKVNPETDNLIDVYSDLSPDKNSEFKSADAMKQGILNPYAQLFHQAVVSGRGSKLKLNKENVLSGKTYVAAAAQEHGLTDGTLPFNKIIARANFLSKKRNK